MAVEVYSFPLYDRAGNFYFLDSLQRLFLSGPGCETASYILTSHLPADEMRPSSLALK